MDSVKERQGFNLYSGWAGSGCGIVHAKLEVYSGRRYNIQPNETRYSFGVSSRNKPIKTLTRETNYTPGLTLAKEKPPSYSFGYLPDAPNNFNTPSPSHYNTNNSTKTSFNKYQ